MTKLAVLGNSVGEYVGGGQADADLIEEEDDLDNMLTSVDEDHDAETVFDDHDDETEDSTVGARPLRILYDCETTGLSIYNEHITEIAAKVIGIPNSSLSKPSFSSLIRTPRNIPPSGL